MAHGGVGPRELENEQELVGRQWAMGKGKRNVIEHVKKNKMHQIYAKKDWFSLHITSVFHPFSKI